MKWVYPSGRCNLCKDFVGLIGVHFGADEAEACTDAVDVGIDRHYRLPEVEHEHAGCGF